MEPQFEQEKKVQKRYRNFIMRNVFTFLLILLGTAGIFTLVFYALKRQPNTKKANVLYAHGIILQKSLDTRTNERKLVYRNEQNKVFIIDDANLWDNAEAGDSVKIGFREGGKGSFYKIRFKSVEVLAKAKNPKEITIFSSDEPDPIHSSSPVIMPMIMK